MKTSNVIYLYIYTFIHARMYKWMWSINTHVTYKSVYRMCQKSIRSPRDDSHTKITHYRSRSIQNFLETKIFNERSELKVVGKKSSQLELYRVVARSPKITNIPSHVLWMVLSWHTVGVNRLNTLCTSEMIYVGRYHLKCLETAHSFPLPLE